MFSIFLDFLKGKNLERGYFKLLLTVKSRNSEIVGNAEITYLLNEDKKKIVQIIQLSISYCIQL